MKRYTYFSGVIVAVIVAGLLFTGCPFANAGTIPTGQDAGAVERQAAEAEKKKAVTEELKKEKEEPEIKKEGAIEPAAAKEKMKLPETKVLIKRIEVRGVTALSPEVIDFIVSPYEGRELSLSDFRAIADLISDEYRKNGYLTSIAYLPPQKIQQDTLIIDVVEGKIGKVSLTGNKYFKTDLLLKYLELKKGLLFNYDTLRENVQYINEHPDRNAAAVLARGEEPGETDINLRVKENLPLHLTLGYNNYNSKYLERNKYSMEIKSTNFLALDHMASVEVQLGEADRYQLYSARYMMPFTPRYKLGANYIHIDQELGRDVGDLKIKGEGDVISAFYSYKLIDADNFVFRMNPAFDYKDIDNEVLGTTLSEDNVRIARMGLDFDVTDRFNGRTIITQEFDYGIKDILGGLKKKDAKASRTGSGGTFFRSVTNAARVQTLPASMSLMLRYAMQLSEYNLVSTEQFHIGGPTTVRGYPVAEEAGDKGYNASVELYIPPYFLPKTLKTYANTTYFDSLRLMAFVDWGLVTNNNPKVGETKREERFSIGPALRFDVPGSLSVSFDYGFGLSDRASDGSHSAGYAEVKMYF